MINVLGLAVGVLLLNLVISAGAHAVEDENVAEVSSFGGKFELP